MSASFWRKKTTWHTFLKKPKKSVHLSEKKGKSTHIFEKQKQVDTSF